MIIVSTFIHWIWYEEFLNFILLIIDWTNNFSWGKLKYGLIKGNVYHLSFTVIHVFVSMDFSMFLCKNISSKGAFLAVSENVSISKTYNKIDATLLRRVPHELFPQKAVPHQIPAGLEMLRKFILAWRLKQIEEHQFR